MIQIALATDGRYVPWVATALRSVLDRHQSGDVTVHVLHERSVDVDRLKGFVEDSGGSLVAHPLPDDRLSELPAINRFGRIVWARFLLPELLAELDRVLYVDADTFVVSSLKPLWDRDLSTASLAAVPNVVEPAMRPHVRALGRAYPGGFFNSGVLLMDLESMRREGIWRSLLRLIFERGDELVWPDQDALNILFADRWLSLHPRWNAMNSLWTWPVWSRELFGERLLREAKADPAILHFEGPILNKPWHYLCPHPAAADYRETLSRTPWAGVPLVDRTIATRLIALTPESCWTPSYIGLLKLRKRVGSLRRSIAERLRG